MQQKGIVPSQRSLIVMWTTICALSKFSRPCSTSIVVVSSYSSLKGWHNLKPCQYLYLATQMTKGIVKITNFLLQCIKATFSRFSLIFHVCMCSCAHCSAKRYKQLTFVCLQVATLFQQGELHKLHAFLFTKYTACGNLGLKASISPKRWVQPASTCSRVKFMLRPKPHIWVFWVFCVRLSLARKGFVNSFSQNEKEYT